MYKTSRQIEFMVTITTRRPRDIPEETDENRSMVTRLENAKLISTEMTGKLNAAAGPVIWWLDRHS
jgi:hypothetical protein